MLSRLMNTSICNPSFNLFLNPSPIYTSPSYSKHNMRDVIGFLEPPPPSPPPPSSQPQNSNPPMLYYGLVVVGAAAIVLAACNLIIIKWCTRPQSRSVQRPNAFIEATTASRSFENMNGNLLTSFKYKKEININVGAEDQGGDDECAVCLSVFEEGEEVRQLPRCKHSFHAPCIDMWLYSHFDCPLCRALVDVPRCHHRHTAADIQENSREGLLGSANAV